MTLSENIRVGFSGVMTHKLRSFLTMLGIIFGVAAVLAMQSIGAGAKKELLEAIRVLGINNIIIQWVELKDDKLIDAVSKNPRQLSVRDADAIKSVLEESKLVVPIRKREATVRLPHEESIDLVGTTADYFQLLTYYPVEGRFLKETDTNEKVLVGVISSALKRKLFPLSSAVGKKVKVDHLWIEIVGVVQPPVTGSEVAGMEDRNYSDDLYIPLTTMQARIPHEDIRSPLQEIVVQVRDEDAITTTSAALQRIMKRLHRGVEDYKIIVPVELLKQSQQTQRIFNIVMGAIASISLIVGGIGIMNIMLSNVLERTREIGIRRAVGATQADIVAQFLVEAVLLSIFGGIIGVILGALMAWLITLYAGWMTVIGIGSIALAFGVSAGVGILFGWWPAKKAAAMNVINALRYE
ncbi:ABC transporter permease [bacterium]|nr:ABC transporter permease [bacterium]